MQALGQPALSCAGVLFGDGILLRVDEPGWGAALMVVSAIPLLHAVFQGVFGRRGPG